MVLPEYGRVGEIAEQPACETPVNEPRGDGTDQHEEPALPAQRDLALSSLDAAEGGPGNGFGRHAPVPCDRIARRACHDMLIERCVGKTRVDLQNVNAEPAPFHAKCLGESRHGKLACRIFGPPGNPRRATIEPMFTIAG